MEQWRVEACEATAGATPEPWRVEGEGNPDMATGLRRWPRVFGPDGRRLWNPFPTQADADFIAGSREWVPRYEEALREAEEKIDWWRDMTSAVLAIADAHWWVPSDVSDGDRLRQVANELRANGVEWESNWKSTNQQLHERAERAEREVERLRALVEEADWLLAFGEPNPRSRDAAEWTTRMDRWQETVNARAVLADTRMTET